MDDLLTLITHAKRENSSKRCIIELESILMIIWNQPMYQSKCRLFDMISKKMFNSPWVGKWLIDTSRMNCVSLIRKWNLSLSPITSSKLNFNDKWHQPTLLSTWLKAKISLALMKAYLIKLMKDNMGGCNLVSATWSLLCKDWDLWVL